jgi:hypothetical protein
MKERTPSLPLEVDQERVNVICHLLRLMGYLRNNVRDGIPSMASMSDSRDLTAPFYQALPEDRMPFADQLYAESRNPARQAMLKLMLTGEYWEDRDLACCGICGNAYSDDSVTATPGCCHLSMHLACFCRHLQTAAACGLLHCPVCTVVSSQDGGCQTLLVAWRPCPGGDPTADGPRLVLVVGSATSRVDLQRGRMVVQWIQRAEWPHERSVTATKDLSKKQRRAVMLRVPRVTCRVETPERSGSGCGVVALTVASTLLLGVGLLWETLHAILRWENPATGQVWGAALNVFVVSCMMYYTLRLTAESSSLVMDMIRLSAALVVFCTSV